MQTDFRRALASLVPVFMPELLFRLGPDGQPLFKCITMLLAMSASCFANWAHNRTYHCCINGPSSGFPIVTEKFCTLDNSSLSNKLLQVVSENDRILLANLLQRSRPLFLA
jgi:hypothetical protein